MRSHEDVSSCADISISVVIPAYNEERMIDETVAALLEHLVSTGARHEVIVVDDGSEDETAQRVESIIRERRSVTLLKNDANLGKGYSVRRGLLSARGRYVFLMDADHSYPVHELDKMLVELRNGYDLAIGSRALPASRLEVRPPLLRYVAGQVYAALIGLLVFRGIRDTQCGFKGLRREAVEDLLPRLTLNDFAFDVELLFLARKYGYRIQPVPVTLRFNADSSKIRIARDSLRMVWDLLRIRWNNARGRYESESRG